MAAIIIARNEEKKIEECLRSVDFCDEILLVDNGSTDKTVEIAKKHNAKIVVHVAESFADIRNYGLKKANGDWVLYVDADERVTKSLQSEILEAINTQSDISGYKIKRKNFYYHSVEWPKIEQLERLFKKSAIDEWYGDLHETPRVKGELGVLNNYLLHYTHDDLSSMIEKTNKWSEIEAQLRFKANHPQMAWWRFPRVMLTAFLDSYVEQGGWKVGAAGLIEGIFQAYSMFVTYAKLWELQNSKK